MVGGTLTMLVLMLFLHLQLRTLLFVPLVIASSLIAAFIYPWFFVVTLALIIATGFSFARGALVVGLAIPISVIGTFLMLNLWGRSLNVVSLAGMAFAVGMLVDNAVVVLGKHLPTLPERRTAAYRRSPRHQRSLGSRAGVDADDAGRLLACVVRRGRSGTIVSRHRIGHQRRGRPVA